MPTRPSPLALAAIGLAAAATLAWWHEGARAYALATRTRHRLAPREEA
jgi:hypothetical protein